MALHKGKPSGSSKQQNKSTGIPSNFSDRNSAADKELTKKYTKNDENIADGVKSKHPNRNVNKPQATNAGGYKN